MPYQGESLRGYAYDVHKRDGFRCVYCGLDGTESFSNWLTLTRDHLLPKGHQKRNEQAFIVTACSFCNTADNHYLEREIKAGHNFDEPSREKLIDRRKQTVLKVREDFKTFWKENVAKHV
jgi:5-methylcytosine-specific restriction endonuclease McrA